MTETISAAPSVLGAPSVTATEWALVRDCLVTPIAPGPQAQSYAVLVERLHAATHEQEQLRAGLESRLYAVIAEADADERARLLPLRRCIHNGRRLAPALIEPARAIARGARIPGLARWLELSEEIPVIAQDLAARHQPALTERRADLARLADVESVARAAAGISPELYDAVVRYAACAGQLDRRSLKSEPNVLRHVMRASTKTVPLSWFVAVGWSPDPGASSAGQVVAVTRPDLALMQQLLDQALLTLPIERRPLHIVPGSHLEPATGRFVFPRRGVSAGWSERLSLPATPLLREVWARVETAYERHGRALTAADLARDLPGGVDATSLHRFVARLVELGALEHTCGVPASDLAGAQRWLRGIGAQAEADTVATVTAATDAYAAEPAAERRAAGVRLTKAWQGALAHAPSRVLTEDVIRTGTLPAPLDRSRLTAVAPLAELFDAFPLLRRVQRHRFVATYGRGGVCHSLAEYARTYDATWTDPTAFDDPAMREDEVATALLHTRGEVDRLADHWTQANGIVDTWIGQSVLDRAAAGLPAQIRSRPTSHSWFVQRDAEGGLTVNQVYGGWGRFASRFLEGLPDSARASVRESILSGLGAAALAAQVRPLGGFAANVHPLVLDTEVLDSGRPARPGDVRLEEIEVVHDLDSDDLRLRRRGTGQWLDVIYQGFLVPMLLPSHLRAIVNDLGSGLTDFSPLRRTVTVVTPLGDIVATGRVQCGTTVLTRRSWILGATQVDALQRLLADESTRQVALARLRSAAGWPRHLFVGSAPSGLGAGLPATAAYTTRMSSQRSQFVDLGDPLHLHTLRKTLTRYTGGLRVEEAWPIPTPGEPTREFVVETYRRAEGPRR